MGVAAVDQDVTLVEQRAQRVDGGVRALAGLDHQQDAARFFKRLDKFFQRVRRHEFLVGMLGYQLVGFFAAAVVHGYRVAAALDVQRQIASHDGEADNADCLLAHVSLRMTEARAARGYTRDGCDLSIGAVSATAFRPGSRARKQWQKRHGHYALSPAWQAETRKRRAERADGARLPL